MTRALIALALLCGCQRAAAWPPAPVAVALGEDACASCRMITSDARFGAQLHDRAGGVQQFDDLGCWQKAVAGTRPDPVATFVRSFSNGEWIRADRAFVVREGGLHTPMGSGLGAFATREAAMAYAERHLGAAVLSWNELSQSGGRKW